MSLGEELRAAGIGAPPPTPAAAPAPRALPQRGLQYLTRLIAVAAVLVLSLVVAGILLHTTHL